MTSRVLYVAHSLAPTPEECEAVPNFPGFDGKHHDVERTRRALQINIDLALRWLAWLRRSFPQDTFIAPWIATVLSLNGDDSAELRDDCTVVERCDGIVLCGSRVSSGMAREADHWLRSHGYDRASWGPEAFRADASPLAVFDLTVLGSREPPTDLKPEEDLLARYRRLVRHVGGAMTRTNDRRGGPYKHLETDEEFIRRVLPGTGAGGRTGETLDNWMWGAFASNAESWR